MVMGDDATMTGGAERGHRVTLADEVERRVRLFRTIFIIQVVGIAIFDVLGSAEQPTLLGLLWINGPLVTLLGLMFVARLQTSRGAFVRGAGLFLFTSVAGITFFIAFYGVRSPLPFISVWPILVSSLLIGPRASAVLATISAAILFGLTLMELEQVVSLPLFSGDVAYPTDWHGSSDPAVVTAVFVDVVTTVVVYYLTAFMGWLSSRNLREALGQSDAMIAELRAVADHNVRVASKITIASARLSEWLRDQQQGAWAQSVAVQKIAENVKTLLESSLEIARRSSTVNESADKSLENDQRIVDSIQTLSTHTERIGEILQVMKEIANKSDILALNAALEGVKAGERGEGFVIVAARIQVMAEDVLSSLATIKTIIEDIRTASKTAITSTAEGTELARQTTELTRQISEITGRQQTGTEQVSRAIADIETVAQQTVVATTEVLQAMAGLVELSNEIRGAAPRPDEQGPPPE